MLENLKILFSFNSYTHQPCSCLRNYSFWRLKRASYKSILYNKSTFITESRLARFLNPSYVVETMTKWKHCSRDKNKYFGFHAGISH